MWPFKKKKAGQRRLEVRKAKGAPQMSLWRRFRQSGGLQSGLIALLFLAAAVGLNIYPLNPLDYRAGQYTAESIHARVYFKVLSERKLQSEIQRLRERIPVTLQMNRETIDQVVAAVRQLPERLAPATQPADTGDLGKQLDLAQSDLDAWRTLSQGQAAEKYAAAVEEFNAELTRTPIVEQSVLDEQNQRRAIEVILRQDGNRLPRGVGELTAARRADSAMARLSERFARLDVPNSDELAKDVAQVAAAALGGRPIYVPDKAATQADMEQAVAKLQASPPIDAYDEYAEDEILVPEETVISQADRSLLEAEQQAYLEAERTEHPWWGVAKIVGKCGLMLLIVAVFVAYVVTYKSELVREHYHAFALMMTLLLMLAIGKGFVYLVWNHQVTVLTVSVLSVMMGSVILSIAYERRFALGCGALLSVLMVMQMNLGLDALIVLFFGSVTSVLLLGEVRRRSKLIEVAGFGAAAVVLSMIFVRLTGPAPPAYTLKMALAGGAAAILVGFLAQGILPLVERIFRVATSMTLLEWCDASKPLLRRLAMEAPGTFNHSLQLGAMCEAAADSIGARGLLARAGAYYHDIGKINKSDYFVENQAGSPNPHFKLSPAMSLLIIIGHVKDGLEMAKEYNLPSVLHEFITSHHGTTLVQYFYHAATEQRKSDVDRAPDEVEFRYPGPKPHSREAAILMLADASESSVRAMPEPTPGRIETQVHTMVSRRLMDGQLDECDLTLREVHQIEASLVRSLCGMYHGRIAYPKPSGQKAAPGETRSSEANKSAPGPESSRDRNGQDANGQKKLPPKAQAESDRIEQSSDQ